MTIYVDIIFLENMFMNCIIILATGIILKNDVRILRILIASFIGSVYAIIIYTSDIKIYSNVFLKIFLSFAIIYVAFKPQNIKSFFKHLVIFYLTSFTFGGVAFALLYFVRPQDTLFQNGALIGTYPIKIILAGGILGFIIITFAFKNIKGKLNRKDMYCNVKIKSGENICNITSIIDTGNFLKEPITKMPVIVIEKRKLSNVFPSVILDNITKIINGEEVNLGEYASKIRAIPFKSIGKENGLILGVKVDNLEIDYQDINHKLTNVIIGIYNGVLSRNDRYSGLVGIDIIK